MSGEKTDIKVNIIGAGLAGLSAAITLAKENVSVRLVSLLPSERSQSVLAEGGINGALDNMGENDCSRYHYEDTMRSGVYIADSEAVKGLTEAAPDILKELKKLGVPFNLKNEQIQQRNFGGQKKKRTAYARSSTGKALMTALIDESRRYEAAGLIQRYSRHELVRIILSADKKKCTGVLIRDVYTDETTELNGPVILATGGLNGFFPELTTGTVTNSGDAAALAFSEGVRFSNLEMIQYHPTTIGITGKRCLISEAARGEGGRLFVNRNGRPWYFMEEKYPELGNLMPRDVVSREMYFLTSDGTADQVWLDMRHLSKATWTEKLPDLRAELKHYLGIDPAKNAIPVEPGIHYFMGGIDVDVHHRTNIDQLYAAGECCSQYHGANRLGGNSTMGAIYGGRTAAGDLLDRIKKGELNDAAGTIGDIRQQEDTENYIAGKDLPASPDFIYAVRDILMKALGIARNENELEEALQKLEIMKRSGQYAGRELNTREKSRLFLAIAMIKSAIIRKESRGAHYRTDHPETRDEYKGKTVCAADKDSAEVKVEIKLIRDKAD